jgi:DNA-binding transcriptional LysR family regulator
MDLDQRQLRAFLAVAETGSLGRAAMLVHLTQPSLSRVIQRMEQGLGHPLFERQSKGMTLTAAGEALLPHARLLQSEMLAARAELDALRGLRRGTVRIGAVAAVMRTLVAQSLGRLLQDFPQLTAEAIEAVDGELGDALVGRRIDLAVTASELDPASVELIGTCDYTDDFAVFCAHANALPQQPTLQQLATQDWVMPGRAMTPRIQFDAICAGLGLPSLSVAVEASSVEAMIAVSASSNLLCWLPEPLLAAHLANGTMRRLDVPAMERKRRFLLYRRRSGLLPRAARQFLDYFPLQSAL